MGLTITSYAIDTNNDFPFVTVPHFELRGEQLLKASGARHLDWNVRVPAADTSAWNNYTMANQGWVQEGLDAQGEGKQARPITPYIFQYDDLGLKQEDSSSEEKLVRWQIAPATEDALGINENLFGTPFEGLVNRVQELHTEVLSKLLTEERQMEYNESMSLGLTESYVVQPVYKELEGDDHDKTIVGYLAALLPWGNYFRNIAPEGSAPLRLVLTNSCGQTVTFEVNGPEVTVISPDQDTHDPDFDYLGVHALVNTHTWDWESHGGIEEDHAEEAMGDSESSGQYWCTFEFTIYPTQAFKEASKKSEAVLYYTMGVVLIFLFTSAVFILYDMFVTKRQSKIEESAARSNAIVQSLFPAQVRDRLLRGEEESQEQKKEETTQFSRFAGDTGKNNVTLDEDEDEVTNKLLRTKPIADLFPHATVMFADICGFTAWSSVREPTQVFTLLEQIYNSFDILARKRRVFKVETIGDCYVAAAGLPDPRPDHAVAMARFSNECLVKMHAVVKKLEVRLGPGTAELGMRFGLHSGPVTAGVLRGEKSRFQLFGDTVNTASRIETTGERNRVHLSEDTAKLLINSGKNTWVEQREGLVACKGKGDMVTYWLTLTSSKYRKQTKRPPAALLVSSRHSVVSEYSAAGTRRISLEHRTTIDDRKQRLIDWNVDVLANSLKKIQAMREEETRIQEAKSSFVDVSWKNDHVGTTVLDEVQEIIALPQQEQVYKRDPQSLELDETVLSQLKGYVGLIASMYQDNSFHNFEHASHVTQSVTKLLSRIVTADDIDYDDLQYKKKGNVSLLHKHTYGITSDPITQFACAFSALIHDVDHTGVPNTQLVKEETEISLFYKNKSVAEQNSVDLAWSLLMENEFEGLRSFIYRDSEELHRFRQLVVNSVMATDIVDKELGAARKARWAKAFKVSDDVSVQSSSLENLHDGVNRKATIVIEHLIQASDVSHTMQHWHVYVKWNEKLFHELYRAFQEGRAEKDPSENWYKGELGFFEFYIIPLAKKLKECGVFGVASDEYLNYAEANREEWERKGEDMVKKYLYSYQKKQDA
jgi:class 3 adenylate cyclase